MVKKRQCPTSVTDKRPSLDQLCIVLGGPWKPTLMIDGDNNVLLSRLASILQRGQVAIV